MIRSIAAVSSVVLVSAISVTPASARSAPLPQGQSAWLTPANTKPWAGFYADLQGATLTVAYLSTYSTTCSTGTMTADNTASMTSSVGDVQSTWTLTRTGRHLVLVSKGPVYESEVTYTKYSPKKAAKLLKQGRKGSTVGNKLLARCG